MSALSAAATAAAGPDGDEDKLVTISNRIENLGVLLDMADRDASMALAAREQQLDFDSSDGYSDMESDVEYNYVGGDAVEPVQQQPLCHFLDWIGRETDRDNSKSEPKVRLTTIHAAKGQEADCVMVIGCHDGLLPLQFPGREVDLEQERNLLYVALTRARDCVRAFFIRGNLRGRQQLEGSRYIDKELWQHLTY